MMTVAEYLQGIGFIESLGPMWIKGKISVDVSSPSHFSIVVEGSPADSVIQFSPSLHLLRKILTALMQ